MNPEQTIIISEIFFSLQGEGPHAGLPTVFIRTAGCNLRCLYCDTIYAREADNITTESYTIRDILDKLRQYPCKRICITGGEPLLQKNPVMRLHETLAARGYSVSMETNGSWPVNDLPATLQAIIDIKTPGSGMSGVNNFENLRSARRHFDIFKFIIADKKDFLWVIDLVKRHRLDRRYRCYVSPAAEQVTPTWLAGQILESGLDLGLNLQLHKLIWPEEDRGR